MYIPIKLHHRSKPGVIIQDIFSSQIKVRRRGQGSYLLTYFTSHFRHTLRKFIRSIFGLNIAKMVVFDRLISGDHHPLYNFFVLQRLKNCLLFYKFNDKRRSTTKLPLP